MGFWGVTTLPNGGRSPPSDAAGGALVDRSRQIGPQLDKKEEKATLWNTNWCSMITLEGRRRRLVDRGGHTLMLQIAKNSLHHTCLFTSFRRRFHPVRMKRWPLSAQSTPKPVRVVSNFFFVSDEIKKETETHVATRWPVRRLSPPSAGVRQFSACVELIISWSLVVDLIGFWRFFEKKKLLIWFFLKIVLIFLKINFWIKRKLIWILKKIILIFSLFLVILFELY